MSTRKKAWETDSSFRPDLLKLIHAALLKTFPPQTVLAFWRRLERHAFFRCSAGLSGYLPNLLVSGQKIPGEFLFLALQNLEHFLAQENCPLEFFIQRAFTEINHGNLLPLRHLLKIWSRFLIVTKARTDFREILLSGLSEIVGLVSRRQYMQIIPQKPSGKYSRNLVVFGLDRGLKTRPGFFDTDLWVGAKIKFMPRILNLPDYEVVQSVLDMRRLYEVVCESMIRYQGKSVFIQEKIMGRIVRMDQFLKSKGLKLPDALLNKNPYIVEMTEDYFCPLRKRIALRKHCGYGAPFQLFQVEYASQLQYLNRTIPAVLENAIEEGSRWKDLAELHERLLQELRPAYCFDYDPAREAMQVNGRHVVRGTPAMILAKVLKQYAATGRTEFERRWFLDDPSLFPNRQDPGFEARLKLLCLALQKACNNIQIKKTGKGLYSLTCNANVSFSLQQAPAPAGR